MPARQLGRAAAANTFQTLRQPLEPIHALRNNFQLIKGL